MATDSQEVQATQMEDSQLPDGGFNRDGGFTDTQVIEDSQMAEPEAEEWSIGFDDSQLEGPAASAIDLDDSQEQAEATQHAADEEAPEAAFWYTEQDISHVLVMLESMQQKLPRNKYTTPVIEDIESLQMECTLIMSTYSSGASNDPIMSTSIKLTIRTHLAMQKYAEIKTLVDNIMGEKKHLKRRASDPPAGGDDDDADVDASSS